MHLVRTIYDQLDLGGRVRPYSEILAWVRSRNDLVEMNHGINTWDPYAELSHTR
jgi:hypothetical protein